MIWLPGQSHGIPGEIPHGYGQFSWKLIIRIIGHIRILPYCEIESQGCLPGDYPVEVYRISAGLAIEDNRIVMDNILILSSD
ncbi:hypothetical protein D3C80_1842670 [compost metagenome]